MATTPTPPEPSRRTPLLLDLDDLTERHKVLIDKRPYPMRGPDQISPLESHEFRAMARRLDELLALAELTEEQKAELDAIPTDFVRRVLEAPPDVLDKLNAYQRMLVFRSFFNLLPGRTPPPVVQPQTAPALDAMPGTGESRSLDSSASTVDAP